MKKELELEERIRLLEKEVNIVGDDIEKLRLDLEERIDSLKLEIQALITTLNELIPDFEERFNSVRETVIREIDPEKLK